MDENRTSEGPPKRLKARVEEVRRHGAWLTILESKEHVWLPAVEYLPDIRRHDDFSKKSNLTKGQVLEVATYEETLRSSRHQHTLVSFIRATDRDPWEQVARWSDGAVKTMEVTMVTATQAFGMIPPGIRGKVPLEDLKRLFPPAWHNFAAIFPGDTVAGYLRKAAIDSVGRVVTLEVPTFIQSEIGVETALSPGLLSGIQFPNGNQSASLNQPAYFGTPAARHILFVDDDVILGISVKKYLTPLGCDVAVCTTELEAQSALENPILPYDLLIFDVHLSDTSDYAGFRLASLAQTEHPGVPIVLITGDESALTKPCAVEHAELLANDLIIKPFGTEELWRAMSARNTRPQALSLFLASGTAKFQSARNVPTKRLDEEAKATLQELAAQTGAECVVLFSLHPVSMRVDIVASHDPGGIVREIKPNIERSPIKDVALDGEEVFAFNAAVYPEFPKHRWLRKAYLYRSCLGLKVSFPSECAHAVFCFHQQKDKFQAEHLAHLRRAVRVIASILHARRLEQMLNEIEPYELLGKAYGSMAHDLKSVLSIDLSVDSIFQSIAEKESPDQTLLNALRDAMTVLGERLRKAAAIVRIFRQVARGTQDDEQEVVLFDVVSETVHSLADQYRPVRRELAVANHFDRESRARLRPIALHQLLFNLVLNAVQQIQRFPLRRRPSGEVFVELAQEQMPDGSWAIIRVHDTGPGIHCAEFERIFDVGISTKEDGFGMGLDICRRIARKVSDGPRCGKVYVLRSIIFVGSVFEVRLPLVAPHT